MGMVDNNKEAPQPIPHLTTNKSQLEGQAVYTTVQGLQGHLHHRFQCTKKESPPTTLVVEAVLAPHQVMVKDNNNRQWQEKDLKCTNSSNKEE